LQQKLRDLERAFKDGFDKKQKNKCLPKYKKRGLHDSFRFPSPQQVKLEYQHVTFPKLGRMRFYRSRAMEGEIKNYTVSRQGKHWTVAIQVEVELKSTTVATKATSVIGLDLGVKHFVTTSNGDHQAPVNSFRRFEKQLAIKQGQQSKKKKFSANWRKANEEVIRIHQRIANIRRDFQHKLSTEICKNHAIIVVEALKIKNMSRSARGSLDNPGQQVAAKSGLNKSILDQGWYEFRRQGNYSPVIANELASEAIQSHVTTSIR